MSNINTLTITGLIATTPRHITTREGVDIVSFRLASQTDVQRTDGLAGTETNWYTVSLFNGLAVNAAASLNKGDRIIVTGALRIRDWENTDRSGTTVELIGEHIGHDLAWGVSVHTRVGTSLTTDN